MGFLLTHVLHMGLLRDAEDFCQAVVEMPEQVRGFDGHPSQEGVQSLRVEQRLQGQRLADVTAAAGTPGQARGRTVNGNGNGNDNNGEQCY